ncbi:hypothetical protein GCM10009621_04900 [Corynebacterium felinum]
MERNSTWKYPPEATMPHDEAHPLDPCAGSKLHWRLATLWFTSGAITAYQAHTGTDTIWIATVSFASILVGAILSTATRMVANKAAKQDTPPQQSTFTPTNNSPFL